MDNCNKFVKEFIPINPGETTQNIINNNETFSPYEDIELDNEISSFLRYLSPVQCIDCENNINFKTKQGEIINNIYDLSQTIVKGRYCKKFIQADKLKSNDTLNLKRLKRLQLSGYEWFKKSDGSFGNISIIIQQLKRGIKINFDELNLLYSDVISKDKSNSCSLEYLFKNSKMFDSIVIEKYFCNCLNTFVSLDNSLSHKDNCFGCFLKENNGSDISNCIENKIINPLRNIETIEVIINSNEIKNPSHLFNESNKNDLQFWNYLLSSKFKFTNLGSDVENAEELLPQFFDSIDFMDSSKNHIQINKSNSDLIIRNPLVNYKFHLKCVISSINEPIYNLLLESKSLEDFIKNEMIEGRWMYCITFSDYLKKSNEVNLKISDNEKFSFKISNSATTVINCKDVNRVTRVDTGTPAIIDSSINTCRICLNIKSNNHYFPISCRPATPIGFNHYFSNFLQEIDKSQSTSYFDETLKILFNMKNIECS